MTRYKNDRGDDKTLREEVLKRDKYTCQMCNKKHKKRFLQYHHIMEWSKAASLRFDKGNCITLCIKCHKSIHRKEVYYQSYFLEILRENRKRERDSRNP